MYSILDVDFDVWIGEAFFEREMKDDGKGADG